MEFDWDEGKSERNRLGRELPFDLAILLFDAPTIERDDRRRDYGERRIVATGEAAGRMLTCVYVDKTRDGMTVRRIVSLRVASRKERQAYADRA